MSLPRLNLTGVLMPATALDGHDGLFRLELGADIWHSARHACGRRTQRLGMQSTETHDPDGRAVILSRSRWEHIVDLASGHPELAGLKEGAPDVSVGHVTVPLPGRGGHSPPSFSIAREISASGE